MSRGNPETRNRILKAALNLLEASQGTGVRMTDIAKRAGITRVVLPEKNRRDVEEIPAHLLAGLELRYAETIDEALEETLLPGPDA